MKETIAIIGLGLMGGSLAKRIKLFRPTCAVIGYDRERDVILSSIDSKVIDSGYMQINQEIRRAKFIVIAVPPMLFPEVIEEITQMELMPGVVITDLLSVKTCCDDWMSDSALRKSYVGGHPICGHEESGFMHSNAGYFDHGFYCIMEPNADNEESFKQWEQFITELRIKTMILSSEEHDELMAYVSHMPHAVSYMMSHLTLKRSDIKTMGKSFKEMTRISKSSAKLWTEIFTLNQQPLLQVLDEMKSEIDQMVRLIKGEDKRELFNYLSASQQLRTSKEMEEVC